MTSANFVSGFAAAVIQPLHSQRVIEKLPPPFQNPAGEGTKEEARESSGNRRGRRCSLCGAAKRVSALLSPPRSPSRTRAYTTSARTEAEYIEEMRQNEAEVRAKSTKPKRKEKANRETRKQKMTKLNVIVEDVAKPTETPNKNSRYNATVASYGMLNTSRE